MVLPCQPCALLDQLPESQIKGIKRLTKRLIPAKISGNALPVCWPKKKVIKNTDQKCDGEYGIHQKT